MLRPTAIATRATNATAVATTVAIVANDRTHITPYSNARNIPSPNHPFSGPQCVWQPSMYQYPNWGTPQQETVDGNQKERGPTPSGCGDEVLSGPAHHD